MNKYILILFLLGCHTQTPQEKQEKEQQESYWRMVQYADKEVSRHLEKAKQYMDSFQVTKNPSWIRDYQGAMNSASIWSEIEQQNLEKLK